MKKSLFSLLALLMPMAAAAYSLDRVSVHDPSVVWDPASQTYYIFGSHRAVAKTTDMMSWKYVALGKEQGMTDPLGVAWQTDASDNAFSSAAFSSPAVNTVRIGGVKRSLPAFDAKAWATRGNKDYDIRGNLWAPDVIWNPTMKKWCMYMSVNGDNWYSSIVLLTSDNIEGPYRYQAPVVISGFCENDAYKDTDLELVIGAQSSLPERYNTPDGKWATRWPNCIDPCVFYDEQGKLWMSYGSWFGGIFMLELDESTGLRDYDVTYELQGTGDGITVDPYYGKKIAGGYFVSGEASYIEHIGSHYFLFVTYGGLEAAGGYQMRVFRSENPDGPYEDVRGTSAVYINNRLNYGATASDSRGENILGAYGNWGNMAIGNKSERAQGHNSIIAAEEGRTYLVYHTRFQNLGEAHEVRVHQVFQNEDGWLVAAPFEYTGEQVKSADIATTQQIKDDQIPGDYQLLIHPFKLDHSQKELAKPVAVKLNEDGTITGEHTGTWTITKGTSYITIKMGNDEYKGVMVEQTLEPTTDKVAAFTAVARNGVTIWGYTPLTTSGISTVRTGQTDGDQLYDLQGRRIDTPSRKGIYIRNGKKIVLH